MDLLEAIAGGTRSPDEQDGRVYGPVQGSITDVSDPQKLGRVKARIGAQQKGESSDWLLPMWPGGCEGYCQVGQPIIVAFVDGDPHRGVFWWYPKSTTTGRANDFALLGTTFIGLYNDLVSKFNFLKSQYNAFVTSFLNHYHQASGHGNAYLDGNSQPCSGKSDLPGYQPTFFAPSQDGDADCGSGLAADNSQPSAIASSTVVLSGNHKIAK
jgi:hypothetical protein